MNEYWFWLGIAVITVISGIAAAIIESGRK